MALRKLTANVMRVTRGAGKPQDIGQQAQAIVDAISVYREAAGHFPWANGVANHLNIWVGPDDREKLGDREYERRDIEDLLISACLQLAASRLLRQPMQEGTAERDLYFALDQMKELDDRRKKRLAAAAKPDRVPKGKGKPPAVKTGGWDT